MGTWLSILDPLGRVFSLYGVIMLAPALFGWLNGEPFYQLGPGGLEPYWLIAIFLLGLALFLHLVGRRHFQRMRARNAFGLVILIWILLPMAGAIPLIHYAGSFTKAYFEAVSGMTASGATMITGIDSMPLSAKLWRGLMSWMGGMGLIVLAVAILPMLGVGGRQLFKQEIPGPFKESEITPQITETAKGLWRIYALLTILCMIAYWLGGMTPLDAVVHSFTTMSLGGFGNHDASFAYFHSPLIEGIAIVFMILAGMNFTTHFISFSAFASSRHRPLNRRSGGGVVGRIMAFFAPYRADIECRSYLLTLVVGALLVSSLLYFRNYYDSLGEALRYGVFNTISIATTTGYSTADYNAWPLFAPMVMLLMANFTACGGSTGGGIKMMRAITLCKMGQVEQVKMLHAKAFMKIRIGRLLMPNMTVSSILFFIIAYILTILLITMLFLLVEQRAPQVTSRILAAKAVELVGAAANKQISDRLGSQAAAVAAGRLEQNLKQVRDQLAEFLARHVRDLANRELRTVMNKTAPEHIATVIEQNLAQNLASAPQDNRQIPGLERGELSVIHAAIQPALHNELSILANAMIDDLVDDQINSSDQIDLLTAFSAAVACVSNTGPGLGDVGPANTYRSFDDPAAWIASLAMLLGRLELMLFLLLFRRELWR